MKSNSSVDRMRVLRSFAVVLFTIVLSIGWGGNFSYAQPGPTAVSAPAPILKKDGKPVDWWFVFKFNAHAFPACARDAVRSCIFGGQVQDYHGSYGQQYVYASSAEPELQSGDNCVGDSDTDPVGATFDEVYHGHYNYVIWNDQFYDDPMHTASSPWGHSKGMLAWDQSGNGFVMQVSTPSWPASGNENFPRQNDGNTLGCVTDNNVKVSQHFFAIRLSESDVVAVLRALQNASVVTDPENPQIVHNGGPQEIQEQVNELGHKSSSTTYTIVTLSSGIRLISKPSALHVPPWQLVSASLNGVPLLAATWWARPMIPTTDADTQIVCWEDSLGKPGAVVNTEEGHWQGTAFSLTGGVGPDHNHAKIGISTDAAASFAIFGDLNQQGALTGNCGSSQNGRGGLFYVVHNKMLNQAISNLIHAR